MWIYIAATFDNPLLLLQEQQWLIHCSLPARRLSRTAIALSLMNDAVIALAARAGSPVHQMLTKEVDFGALYKFKMTVCLALSLGALGH